MREVTIHVITAPPFVDEADTVIVRGRLIYDPDKLKVTIGADPQAIFGGMWLIGHEPGLVTFEARFPR